MHFLKSCGNNTQKHLLQWVRSGGWGGSAVLTYFKGRGSHSLNLKTPDLLVTVEGIAVCSSTTVRNLVAW